VSSTSMPSLISVVRCATSSMCWMPGVAGISPCALASACCTMQNARGQISPRGHVVTSDEVPELCCVQAASMSPVH
jgi:hypothetical protein